MMKKESWLTRIAITLITILLLTGCTSRSIVEGSEATYYGIVTDRAMSSNQYDRYGRPYISILIDSDEGMLFWCADEDPTPDEPEYDGPVIETPPHYIGGNKPSNGN